MSFQGNKLARISATTLERILIEVGTDCRSPEGKEGREATSSSFYGLNRCQLMMDLCEPTNE